MLLFKALKDAANSGVRVRLLIDDNNTAGLDATLAALDAHPNIEVRLFNPFTTRRPHWLGYLTDFARLNRRMHNKSFTADGKVTIVGGRNIGDEYFEATSAGVFFADLDIMGVGAVAEEVSDDFGRYWRSEASCPLDRLVPRATPADVARLDSEFERVEGDPAAVSYLEAVRGLPFVRRIMDGSLPLESVPVRVISDDPEKALGHERRKTLVIEKLKAIFGEPCASIDLISPYFVPGATGTESLRRWAEDGVAIRVLTNALESTDVAAVHAGYAKRRKALLAGGVKLYELRRTLRMPHRRAGPIGSSTSSLHAKTFAADGCRVFVGSFNFDPRSARLNTEMGFVIDSANLAQEVSAAFDAVIPSNAYEVHLSAAGRLYWTSQDVRYDTEPGVTASRRAAVWLASRLPIEWLL